MKSNIVLASITLLLFVTIHVNAQVKFGADGLPIKKGRNTSPLKATAQWKGKVKEKALQESLPKGGFITNNKSLEKLWSDWSVAGEVPQVDFDKEIVLVATVTGPNNVMPFVRLNKKGDIKLAAAGTKIFGPGFGYAIITVSNKGVKSVNGKSIAGNQNQSGDYVKVEVKGQLTTGIMAIGGETTGVLVSANGITWELDFGKNRMFRKKSEGWGGKKVVVAGILTRRKGVEVRERWIVKVASIHLSKK